MAKAAYPMYILRSKLLVFMLQKLPLILWNEPAYCVKRASVNDTQSSFKNLPNTFKISQNQVNDSLRGK